jgi:hypothetical protein
MLPVMSFADVSFRLYMAYSAKLNQLRQCMNFEPNAAITPPGARIARRPPHQPACAKPRLRFGEGRGEV